MLERPFNHAGYSQFLAEHRLMAARCLQCGRILLPPRPLCPDCYSTALEWMALSGKGIITGYTVIRPPLKVAESSTQPHCAGIIQLEEGVSISGEITAPGGVLPDPVAVGMPVQIIYQDHPVEEEELKHLVFVIL